MSISATQASTSVQDAQAELLAQEAQTQELDNEELDTEELNQAAAAQQSNQLVAPRQDVPQTTGTEGSHMTFEAALQTLDTSHNASHLS